MPNQLRTNFSQIVIEKPEKKFSIIKSFVARPDSFAEKNIGTLFGLVEIKTNQPSAGALVDFIIAQAQSTYYKQFNRDQWQNIELENFFESALKKLNISIAAFIETESINIDLKKINIVIGAICNQRLVFTQVGKINVYLAQKLTHHFRLIDILESTKAQATDPDPLKLFSQVINGQLRIQDILFIASDNVFDYFSLDTIKYTLSTTTGSRSVAFHELFNKIIGRDDFGILLLESEKNNLFAPATSREQAAMTVPQRRVSSTVSQSTEEISHDSMKLFTKKQDETQKLLTPTLLPELKKYSGLLRNAFNNYLSKIHVHAGGKKFDPRKINIHKPQLSYHTPFPATSKKINSVGKKVRVIAQALYHESRWQKLVHAIARGAKNATRPLVLKFNNLPRKSRYLLSLSVLLGIFLAGSITIVTIRNNQQRSLAAITTAIDEAQAKVNNSQASLIYRDENLARQQLIEAKNLVANLKPATTEQSTMIDQINQSIEAQLSILRHEIKISDLVQIANFKNVDPQMNANDFLLRVGQNIFVQDTVSKNFYSANLESRAIESIFIANANAGLFTTGFAVDQTNLLLINEAKNAYFFNTTNNQISTIALTTTASVNIESVKIFNSRLYLLDSNNEQIYRYNRIGNGFGQSTNWITAENRDLSTAVDLIIDGNIFVLKDNGVIEKYTQGDQVEFTLATIDPLLTAGRKLFSPEGSDFLYVLDPEKKRIVIFNKNGQLVNQYTSDQFTNLKDFAIDEAQKRIYVLNDATIFGFGIR